MRKTRIFAWFWACPKPKNACGIATSNTLQDFGQHPQWPLCDHCTPTPSSKNFIVAQLRIAFQALAFPGLTARIAFIPKTQLWLFLFFFFVFLSHLFFFLHRTLRSGLGLIKIHIFELQGPVIFMLWDHVVTVTICNQMRDLESQHAADSRVLQVPKCLGLFWLSPWNSQFIKLIQTVILLWQFWKWLLGPLVMVPGGVL